MCTVCTSFSSQYRHRTQRVQISRIMMTAVAVALTAASLSIGVLSAHPSNFSETRHTWHVKSESQNVHQEKATEPSQNNAPLSQIAVDTRKAVRNTTKRWPSAIVPYSISPSIDSISSSARRMISEAMAHWERETCIRFVPASNRKGKDNVVIEKGVWCASHVGRIGGRQSITLAEGCLRVGTIIHELGHAIGWKHEHQRPDRDKYLTIASSKNINGNQNYAKYSRTHVDTFGLPYDYCSIMHYPGSSNTLVAIEPSMQQAMGQRFRLSFYDVKLANLMYKCAEQNRCDVASIKCTGEGYVGPRCRCVCSDGSTSCSTNRATRNSTTGSVELQRTSKSAKCRTKRTVNA